MTDSDRIGVCGYTWRTSGVGPGMVDHHMCSRRKHRFGECACDCGKMTRREPRWRRWLWGADDAS